MQDTDTLAEAGRAMDICNACRYCEGFCAVFPAMERRRSFLAADLTYLANLCHNCRGCFYACQYAPPHEFGINLPQTFAQVRAESYEAYAWPGPLARLFRSNGTIVSLSVAFGIALVLLALVAIEPAHNWSTPHTGSGAFYAVIPWSAMAAVAGITFLYSLLAMTIGGVRFWRATGGGRISLAALSRALHDIASLTNLGGGGDGCNDRDEAFSMLRRRFHHALFYGFLLCFAATCVATFYDHFLHWPAPYPFFTLPVLLGTAGGIGMVVGTIGFLWVKATADPAPAVRALLGGDYALLFQLLLAAASGLVLLAARDTTAMGILLAIHLGCILSLFVTMPYSKFVHGLYRSLALLRNAKEADESA